MPRAAAWLDNLLGEVRRSALSFGPAAVSRVFLAGAASAVPGLGEALQAELGVAPVRLSCSEAFPDAELQGESAEAADRCLLAIGQGLQPARRSEWTISLLPREVAQARRALRLRRAGLLAALLLVLGMASGYVFAERGIARLERRVTELKERAKTAGEQRAYAEGLLTERARLRDQVDALEPARVRRYVALELLRSIALYAPEEVVLTHFLLRPQEPLVIRGTAPDSAEVADLQQVLAGAPLVTDVSLTTVDRRVSGDDVSGPASFSLQVALWKESKSVGAASALAPWGGAE